MSEVMVLGGKFAVRVNDGHTWAVYEDDYPLEADAITAAQSKWATGAARYTRAQYAMPETYGEWEVIKEGLPKAPVNTAVPHVTGTGEVGSTLQCTMGTWDGMEAEPHSYDYQWKVDEVTVVGTSVGYVVTAADVGHSLTCVVTATSPIGSTEAPPSNAVVAVAAGAPAAAAASSSSSSSSSSSASDTPSSSSSSSSSGSTKK